MKGIEKDFIASFIIACIVSFSFYYTNLNNAQTKIDLYWIEFGMIMPFCLPLFFLFKILRAKKRTRRLLYGR